RLITIIPSPLSTLHLPPTSTLFPYTTLFRSRHVVDADDFKAAPAPVAPKATVSTGKKLVALLEYPSQQDNWWQSGLNADMSSHRSEEHTSELQSRFDLVCRLLLEKKKTSSTS